LCFSSTSAAFGAPDARGATRLCAAIVTRSPLDPATLQATLRAKLDFYTPTFVIRVDKVPRNAGGKIMRDALVAMANDAGLAQA